MKIYFLSDLREDCFYISLNQDINENCILTSLQEIFTNLELYLIPIFPESTEIGPKKNMETSWSTNAKIILEKSGVKGVRRIEYLKRYSSNSKFTFDEMTEEIYNTDQDQDQDPAAQDCLREVLIDDVNMGFDITEKKIYQEMFEKMGRNSRYIELFDLSQSNSEHSRHWFFNGILEKNDTPIDITLMQMIKDTLEKSKSNSLVAFSDNSSVIKGFDVTVIKPFDPINNSKFVFSKKERDIVFTAETHNFPTGVCPFPGAATGIGGRIRDNHATGRGAYLIAATAGYCVGNLFPYSNEYSWEDSIDASKDYYNTPLQILINASNGASDYGNKIGEPIIGGFTRAFGITNNEQERIEWIKPIMFTGGIGQIERTDLYKKDPTPEMFVIRLGGPAYRIGIGGGAASSQGRDSGNKSIEQNAVQRGDPEMENKLNKVIRAMCELEDDNPIISIHDQGAGGLANVVKEIIYPMGGDIYLDKVTLGDETLTPLEIWCGEYQESDTILVKENGIHLLDKICIRENLNYDIIGKTNDSGKVKVFYKGNIIVDLPLKDVLKCPTQKKYELKKYYNKINYISAPLNIILIDHYYNISFALNRVLKNVAVCSKRFLTNKVDRSVTGLVVQQQCVGPFHTPISNYSLVALSYFDNKGIASSIGEKPILGLLDPRSQGTMSVGEMITNLMGVRISCIEDIKCSGNWMWPLSEEGEKDNLYKTAKSMCQIMEQLGIAIDGGKDSLSMCAKIGDTKIKAPGALVISSYVSCPAIKCRVTPDLKKVGSKLIFIDLADGQTRIGGSILEQVFKHWGNPPPNCDDPDKLRSCFNYIQQLIFENKILSLHDRSDGGLITTIIEMCIAGNLGCQLNINSEIVDVEKGNAIMNYLFNEELGVIIEVESLYCDEIINALKDLDINSMNIGEITDYKAIQIYFDECLLHEELDELRKNWEFTSYNLEKKQCNLLCVEKENRYLTNENIQVPTNHLPTKVSAYCSEKIASPKISDNIVGIILDIPRIAIIREEGSNGDREMAAAFASIGFEVHDIHMNDLQHDNILQHVNSIAFVGGFSYSDVFGAAQGWYSTIVNNEKLRNQFDEFYKREDTFSLGVCNGCQLLTKLGWIEGGAKLERNISERFESRFTTVKVRKSNSIFFKDMEDTEFGMWVAHGEGRFTNTETLYDSQKCLYYSDQGEPAQQYPLNPNGSEDSLAGICSRNGRHLAIMPHPERCFLKWQLPWIPQTYTQIKRSPWQMMFENSLKYNNKSKKI